jgi:hypothetical protein
MYCEDQVLKYNLHNFGTLYMAELYAVYQAPLFIRR